jgi:predicted dehydrogenase
MMSSAQSGKMLGVCVVGCGDMGGTHVRAWMRGQAGRVVAVADPDEARAQKLAKECGLDRHCTDYREAVARPDVQIVSVCTPTCFHAAVSLFAMEQGKHVLCEKPIALTTADAQRMIATAEQRGLRLAVGFVRRFGHATELVTEHLAKGTIGRPVMFRHTQVAEIRPKRAMHDRRQNNGPVVDTCCHNFDMWRVCFASEPKRVTARGFTFGANKPELSHLKELAVDTAAIIVEFASGDLGLITICWGMPPGTRYPGGEDVLGPNGIIKLGGVSEITVIKGGSEQKLGDAKKQLADLHVDQTTHFARAVAEGGPVKASGADGLAALKVSLAALESIATGKTVELG